GSSGLQGSVGPTGSTPPGPVATGILYAYLGCYVQTGSSTVTTGRALTSYQGTFTGQVNSRCSSTCLTLNFVYFGTVNQGTSSADCWCGNAISYVTVNSGLLSGTTGEAGEDRFLGVYLELVGIRRVVRLRYSLDRSERIG
ncbi:unnamed protein product, partial [Aureobasidium pullulans]